MGLLNQQANLVNNAMKNGAVATTNNGKMNNGVNGNTGKKGGGGGGGGNPNQNMGMKAPPGGIDQRNMAATKMINAHLGGGGNLNAGEYRKENDINALMGLAGLQGHGAGVGLGANGLGFQPQANNAFQGSSAGFATGGQQQQPVVMPNLQGYQFSHPSAVMNMNMQNRNNINSLMMNEGRYMQPQMMYHRAPIIPPTTGYYYNYCSAPTTSSYPESSGANSATHMFSDENTDSCAVM